MQYLFVVLTLCFGPIALSQEIETCDSILELRKTHSVELQDTAAGVLNADDLKHFKALNYFPCSNEMVIEAKFKKKLGRKFEMPTSTDRKPIYRRYGYVYFELNGQTHRLTVFQNMSMLKNPDYADYLFLPFRDATSGETSYGGGRYLDLHIPEGTTITLNFNKVYNPYCAYSYRYSCPIPPNENTLEVPIKAGEQTPTYHNEDTH